MEEKEAAAASNTERRIILVGVDDSEHSVYALKWTLNHFFGENAAAALVPNYKLVILHAKPIPSAVVGIGPGTSEAYIQVELCLKSSAAKALGVAKELCAANSGGCNQNFLPFRRDCSLCQPLGGGDVVLHRILIPLRDDESIYHILNNHQDFDDEWRPCTNEVQAVINGFEGQKTGSKSFFPDWNLYYDTS